MEAILPFMKDDGTFDPKDIRAMSMALDDVCTALNISADATRDREIIATRIIGFARRGERSPTRLRDHVLKEAVSVAPAAPARETRHGVAAR